MTSRRRPKASLMDLAFLRSLIDEISELRMLRRILFRRVQSLRFKIAQRVVTALYRRYNVYTKHLEARPGFLEWLDERKLMSKTYLRHSHEVRLYWASRPVFHASRAELSLQLSDDVKMRGDDRWYFDLLEELINKRDPREEVWLSVTKVRSIDPEQSEPSFKLKKHRKAAS